MDDTLLTVSETAEFLKISIHTLNSWRNAEAVDKPPYIKVGTSVRYRRSDLEAWLASRTIDAGGARA